MDQKDITNKLTKIFKTEFEDNELVLSAELTANDIDNWTSLTNVLLLSEIENCFKIKFKIKEVMSLDNVGDLIEIISNKMS